MQRAFGKLSVGRSMVVAISERTLATSSSIISSVPRAGGGLGRRTLIPSSSSALGILGGVRHGGQASYKPAKWWKEAHMDDLPVPQGSWDTDNKAKQRKYNRHLTIGVSFFVFTIFVLKVSGLVTLNATIPELPKCSE